MQQTIEYSSIQLLPPMLLDYLEKKNKLQDYITDFPSDEAIEKQCKIKSSFGQRQLLVDVLNEQYGDKGVSEIEKNNIQLLLDENTFTVTTGHQICFLTGPLFFPIKILQAINLCERLREKYRDKNFVPVFWMATEDHDYEEIQKVNLFGKEYKTDKVSMRPPVGKLSATILDNTLQQVYEVLEKTEGGKEAKHIIAVCREKSTSLANFCFHLVRALFGKYGIVVLDADHPRLKKSFLSVLEEELYSGIGYKKVQPVTEKIRIEYSAQITPRPINLFYISDNGNRYRIDKNEAGLHLVGTDETPEWKNVIKQHPEKLSPNVVLRPLYQEFVLPNVAYVGGGAEVKYWMQLKSLFVHFQMPFPLLIMRSSVVVAEPHDYKKLQKIALDVGDIFQDEFILTEKILNGDEDLLDTHAAESSLSCYLDELLFLVKKVDKSLEGKIRAHHKQEAKYLKELRAILKKRLKERKETELLQAIKLKEKWMPNGVLHERSTNLFEYIAKYGFGFVDELKRNVLPYGEAMKVFKTS